MGLLGALFGGDRVLYRITRHNPPRIEDFMSDAEKNQPRRRPQREDERLYIGISMMDTHERAAAMAAQYNLGRYIVEVRIPGGSGVQVHKTRGPGHYTVIRNAEALFRLAEQQHVYEVDSLL